MKSIKTVINIAIVQTEEGHSMRTELELWLDESGEFKYDDNKRRNPSLVGGVLVKKGHITEESAQQFIGRKTIHYTELNDGSENMKLIEWVKQQNGTYVIFENKERVQIIDSDTTYLNVLAEGIIRLLSHLSAVYRDFTLRVLIATRKRMSDEEERKSGIIEKHRYEKLLRERIIVGLAREALTNKNDWDYHIEFDDARTSYRLMLADGICNTYLTRTATRKFTEEQRVRIKQLYDDEYIFSFFEHTRKAQLKRLLAEGNLAEVIFECYLDSNRDIKDEFLTLALERLAIYHEHGQQLQLDIITHKIATFIKFDRNYTYIKPVLESMQDDLLTRLNTNSIDIPTFDLDIILYLYTVYTHEGSTKAIEQDRLFLEKLHEVKDIMKKFEYFNMYTLRRAINEKNMLNIEGAIKDSTKAIRVLEEMVDLMEILDEDIELGSDLQKYEVLGKAYGTRGQGYMMLIQEDESNFQKAIDDFSRALEHFQLNRDKERQYLYTSQAYAEAGKLDEAITWLYEATFIEREDDKFKLLLQTLKNLEIGQIIYRYHTYFKILESAVRHDQLSLADELYDALARENIHVDQLRAQYEMVHPMQFILWNYATYLFAKGRDRQAHSYLDEAIERCENKGLTIQVIQLGMFAEKILMDEFTGNNKRAERTKNALRESVQKITDDKKDTTSVMAYLNNITDDDINDKEKLRTLITLTRCIN